MSRSEVHALHAEARLRENKTPLQCVVSKCFDPTIKQGRGKGLCSRHFYLLVTKPRKTGPKHKAQRDRQLRSPKGRWSTLKTSAKKRGLSVTITFEDHQAALKSSCHWCDRELAPSGSGLDRLDNSRGYEPGNVVPCCKNCNAFRGDNLDVEEAEAVFKALKKVRDRRTHERQTHTA